MAIQIELIKSIPYFTSLSVTELSSIVRFFVEKVAERGEMLLFEGEPASALYFVISGTVKVFKTSAEGKEQILQLVRPGESFNDVPVLSGGLNLASAEAISTVILYVVKKDDFAAILQAHPPVVRNTINVLAQQVQRLVALVEDLSFRDVTSRVARILLENAGDTSTPGQRLTQQEMAAMAGTAREMVGRSLKTLEEEKLIRLDHHRIIIANKEALKEMAGLTI